jgi:serine/threonine protein kinase
MIAHPDSTTDVQLAGAIIAGKYRIVGLIGSGGMGTVWEGVHIALGTRVAVKFIKPAFAQQNDARRRFDIEARAAAKLQSKHAVRVHDYGVTDDGIPYIVMEYLEGESLSDAIVRRGPLPPGEVSRIITQASRALAKAHALGIVHRDLKPDNIFLAEDHDDAAPEAPSYTVKLVDFGIAKMFEPAGDGSGSLAPAMGGPTQDGAVIGTPNFMSPEQLTEGGAPGPLTDLWSLGASAFSAMTGRIPFGGDVLGDIVLKVCVAPLPVPSALQYGVPPEFDAWFARACAREPGRRFQTALELAETLSHVCGVGTLRLHTLDEDQIQYALRPATGESADDVEVPNSMSPRTALMAGLVLGIALMVALLGAMAWRANTEANAPSPPPSALPALGAAATPRGALSAATPTPVASPVSPRPTR